MSNDYEVRSRREQIMNRQRSENPNSISFVEDSEVYEGYPTNYAEYVHGLKVQTLKVQAAPKGSRITHPKYGVCEVLDHIYLPGGLIGFYSLRVLTTGKVVEDIRIGDSQIRRC